MWITLNGDRYEIARPLTPATPATPATMTVAELLAHLAIDGRRVAIELNLVVLRRDAFGGTIVREGDAVEIVNFVGGG